MLDVLNLISVLKKTGRSSRILLLAAFSAFLPAVAAPKEAEPSEWIITNLHLGSGTYKYFLSENAVRIDNTGNGGIVVAKAPTWRVSCFRPKDSLEFTSPLKQFDASRIFSFVPGRHSKEGVFECKDRTTETIKGLKCTRYNLPGEKIYWTVAELKSAPQVSETVSRYFSNTDVGAVPIRIMNPPPTPRAVAKKNQQSRGANPGKSAVPWLNMKNLEFYHTERLVTDLISWKKVPYKDSDFDYPKGYKQTSDLKQVIISEENRKEIMELIDTIGPAKDKGAENK